MPQTDDDRNEDAQTKIREETQRDDNEIAIGIEYRQTASMSTNASGVLLLITKQKVKVSEAAAPPLRPSSNPTNLAHCNEEVSRRIWEKLFGQQVYQFTYYKSTIFACLQSDQPQLNSKYNKCIQTARYMRFYCSSLNDLAEKKS